MRLEVQDTGIGIHKERLKHIFDKFSQADASTTRKFGGTGLGLSICKNLIDMMDGDIGVDSIEGVGSTFFCVIPLTIDETKPQFPTTPAADLKDVRILLVGCHETSCNILYEELANWGIRCEIADSDDNALTVLHEEYAAGDPYKIVIMDSPILNIEDETLSSVIKKDPDLQQTKILMLTYTGWRGDAKRAKKEGIDVYLHKPVHESQLMSAMTMVLTGQSTELITRHTIHETDIEKKQKVLETKGFLSANILLVEDNAVNQKVGVRMLEKLNCKVSVAVNGKEAVSMVEEKSYDLIFMDCQMPEMDGYEATAEIRRREGGAKHITIVAMTAHVMGGARERCIEAGMDDYISKPIQHHVLREVLQKYLPKDMSAPSSTKEAESHKEKEKEPPVDFSHIKDIFGDDTDAINELINIYVNDADQLLVVLESAVHEKNAELIKNKAHSIKGASANIGAGKLRQHSAELEQIGMSGRIEEALNVFGNVKTEFERVKIFLLSKLS
jgi:CheY-like chemotaxis protein/HPt (histidine-containing phosphotransfer) domain-containing protein